MQKATLAIAIVAACALTSPGWSQGYPVSGKWGESSGSEKGAIDCQNRRVIEFDGNQRKDSGGGVPAYRNRSVTAQGSSEYRVVDEFTTGQISQGGVNYTLRKTDADRIEMQQQKGGTIKLQRCK